MKYSKPTTEQRVLQINTVLIVTIIIIIVIVILTVLKVKLLMTNRVTIRL